MALTFRALLAIATLAGAAAAQHAGGTPPALVWDKLMGDCPANLDWTALRGKVVVVSLSRWDVSASDAAGWEEAAKALPDQRVSLFQVVGGSEFLLDQALKQAAYHGCVLFDPDERNSENFKLPRFPRTVVVDPSGFIAGYARGGDDIGDAVRALLAGQPATGLDATPPQFQPYDPAAGLESEAPYEVHISPALPRDRRYLGIGGKDRYVSRNLPLKVIILDLWNTPLTRIALPEKLPEGNYTVTAYMPGVDREFLLQLVRDEVERHFGFHLEKEVRTAKVYLLTALEDPSPQLRPSVSGDESSGGGQGEIVGTARAMCDIASAFEDILRAPVIDETALKGAFDYSASSKLPEPDATFDLAHQLGLKLTEAERPIEILVARKVR